MANGIRPTEMRTPHYHHQRSPLITCINNVPITEAGFVKYLGVVIDSKLTWKEHIKQVLSKSNASLAILWRNLRACSRNIKEHCYKTSVRPIIEYASNIWAPHTTQDIINKIETLQRRAACFVCNGYNGNTSVTNLLYSLGSRQQDHI